MKTLPFAETWMDLEIIIQWSKKKQILHNIAYMWNLEKWYGWNKAKIEPQIQRTNLQLSRGEGGDGTNWETGTDIQTLLCVKQASPGAETGKNLTTVQETQVQPLGWEGPVEKRMATHSSVPAWRIPRTEAPGGLQSMGGRVGQDWATNTHPCKIITDEDLLYSTKNSTQLSVMT